MSGYTLRVKLKSGHRKRKVSKDVQKFRVICEAEQLGADRLLISVSFLRR